MELASITRRTPNPPGGEIVKGPDGEPTGLLRETAQRLVGAAQARADSARIRRGPARRSCARRFELAARGGALQGRHQFPRRRLELPTIDFLKKLEAEGALPVRLYVMVRRESNAAMDRSCRSTSCRCEGDDYPHRALHQAADRRRARLARRVAARAVRRSARERGSTLETPEDIEGTADVAIKHGFQVNTHAIGDRANREVLDIYEQRVQGESGQEGSALAHRARAAHRPGRRSALRAARRDRGDAGHRTPRPTGRGSQSDSGEERAIKTSYVFRDLMKTGAIISNGTDVPVEDIDPIASFYCGGVADG